MAATKGKTLIWINAVEAFRVSPSQVDSHYRSRVNQVAQPSTTPNRVIDPTTNQTKGCSSILASKRGTAVHSAEDGDLIERNAGRCAPAAASVRSVRTAKKNAASPRKIDCKPSRRLRPLVHRVGFNAQVVEVSIYDRSPITLGLRQDAASQILKLQLHIQRVALRRYD